MATPAPPPPFDDNPSSHPLLRLIFERSGEGIAVFDAGWRLQSWNVRFVALMGLEGLEGLGGPMVRRGVALQELLPARVRAGEHAAVPAGADALHEGARLGDGATAPLQHLRPDGRTIELRRSPALDGGWLVLCTDITERLQATKPLSDRQRILSLLIERTEQGIWAIDNDLRTTDANPAMCRMLGLTLAEMMGRGIYDFVDEANARIFREGVVRRSGGRAEGYEVTLLRADGGRVHCFNYATPLSDAQGRKIGAVGMFSDVSPLKQAEQQVRLTGELLAQKTRVLEVTLQGLSQGVLSIDTHGRTNAYNQRFLDLLKIPEALMRTQPTLQEVREYQMAQGHIPFAPAGLGLEAWQQRPERYQRATHDGLVLDVQTHPASDGSLVRTYTDVTARVRAQQALQESESRFRSMADGAPAFIWLAGPQGRPVWFNQRWLRCTGRPMEVELTLDWSHRIHADDLDACHRAYAEAESRQAAYEVEFRVQPAGPGGAVVWVADHGIPRFGAEGQFEGFIAYGWDITERKAAQAGLTAAKDEAERANRAKSEFLSRMSHELRTPLNAVLGFGQLMENDAADRLSPLQRSRVQELMRGGRHLLSLINDVLDLARIEAGTLHLALAPVALDEVVYDCLRLVQASADQRGIALQPRPGPAEAVRVMADPTRLKQVLLNLLSNAIKYNRPGGQVQVAWGCDADATDGPRGAGTTVHLEVRDDGPGLGAEQQLRLFHAFERLGAERTEVEGAGIGLALSKWLVELMQGCIGVTSAPGEGCVFRVSLARASGPARPAAALPAARLPAGPPARSGPPQTVLYIEDNEVNQLLMEGMLGQRPALRLVLASQPEAGLALASSARPDLVLLDIQLPGMDGFEVLRRLRADPATRRLPVVAVSANAMPADRAKAALAGFDDYVTKPIDIPHLLAVVDHLLAG